jgi:purine-binding chemotaxis protein CheW
MQNLFLIAVIAGTEVAICSDYIESVVTVGEAIHVPQCDPLVAGLFALRSRVLTLIDCQYAVSGQNEAVCKNALAVIAVISGHPYGLLVQAVRDVVSVDPHNIKPASTLDPRWSGIVSHMVEVDNRMLMVLSPPLLLSPKQALAA